jgi:superfamily II DNA/RNA helicase
MCRQPIHPSKLTRLGSTNQIVSAKPEEPQLEKKSDALLRIIRDSPEGRLLVFSRYDNPFSSIEKAMSDDGLTVKQLKGNKDVIAATLNAFDKGKFRCLLLNAGYAGAGLNITAATHVILLHAMTSEEEKQILGRAYRMGRKGPLQFIKLLHADEMGSPTVASV